jgi:hypothetical protein
MDVSNAFYGIILKFGQEVGMKEVFAQSIEILAGATLVIALLSCFFGFKLLRLCSAVMAFFLTAIAICEMLNPIAHMGAVVTTFAVVGLIAAFLVFQWYKFSIFLFSAIIGYSIAAVFTSEILICFGAAVVLGAVSLPFSSIIVILSTAIWGGVTLGFGLLSYIGVNLIVYKILAAVGLAAAGLYTQYSMNKNHLISANGSSSGRHVAKH